MILKTIYTVEGIFALIEHSSISPTAFAKLKFHVYFNYNVKNRSTTWSTKLSLN